jgi:hypothetical protein
MYSTLRQYCKPIIRHLHGNILTQVNDQVFNEKQQVAPILARGYEGNFGLNSWPCSSTPGGEANARQET